MNILVQAGGRGSRLGYHTDNKPKAMVSVDNLPMIFHLFQKFPQDRFLIIADYKSEVLKKYLKAFAKAEYEVIEPKGHVGTCSGINEALKHVPDGERFAIVWSDLVLSNELVLPSDDENYMGVSERFRCRWRFAGGHLEEIPSDSCGVAGFFLFKNKAEIYDVPDSGEFVRWLGSRKIEFKPLDLRDTREYGEISSLTMPAEGKCRPFNTVRIEGDKMVKEAIDDQGRVLAASEMKWYTHIKDLGYTDVPQIYSFWPLVMELIDGKNVYSYKFDSTKRREVLEKMIRSLRKLHEMEKVEPDRSSIMKAYYGKTMERLERVREMIPHADEEIIYINKRACRNVLFHMDEVKKLFEDMECPIFNLIHGDCTFSNIVLRNGEDPVFIDPRGYFGDTEIYGDPRYDWAKLYYSLLGNYDQYNLRRFKLKISDEIELKIDSNGWEDMEDPFFEILSTEVDKKSIKLIHAMIWLSLTTYAWDDYDSICGAFYNGLYYLEEIL